MRLYSSLIMAVCVASSVPASQNQTSFQNNDADIVASCKSLPNGKILEDNAVVVVVSIEDQQLVVVRDGKIIKKYPVSTAKAGVGSQPNSDKTPLGWHRISEWIGGDAVPGQSFVSRKAVNGEILKNTEWSSNGGRDYVLTRIMWLDGLEWGKNKGPGADSHARYIYIHGTNQEHLLGKPASHGCIRLSNHDVMVVYALTEGRPSYVNIVERFL